jgi:hypothetical protein
MKCRSDNLQIGFTSPMYRGINPFAKEKPQPKRNPIGFVHFGEPEEEPRSDWEYRQLIAEWEDDEPEICDDILISSDEMPPF